MREPDILIQLRVLSTLLGRARHRGLVGDFDSISDCTLLIDTHYFLVRGCISNTGMLGQRSFVGYPTSAPLPSETSRYRRRENPSRTTSDPSYTRTNLKTISAPSYNWVNLEEFQLSPFKLRMPSKYPTNATKAHWQCCWFPFNIWVLWLWKILNF